MDVDLDVLRLRSQFYAQRGGASNRMQGKLASFLSSNLVEDLLKLSDKVLRNDLILDAYKPKMHKTYAAYFSAVDIDFALNVRKSPISLHQIRIEQAQLYEKLVKYVEQLSKLKPVTDRRMEILQQYYAFQTSKEMQERSSSNKSASIQWYEEEDNVKFVAQGTIDSASSLEAGCTQAVQSITIEAQVQRLREERGIDLSRSERIANSLGHLACICEQLENVENLPKLALFAGRRSTDRLFLLLQNAFCAVNLPNYIGTSAILAVEHIDAALQDAGMTALEERKKKIGVLIGTHAHEVMSIVGQLMSCWDQKVKSSEGGPVALSALLAHLLFLAANGGLEFATALADTFGTETFLAAAMVSRVPQEFIEDVGFDTSVQVPEDAVVFDLIRVWRVDSGDYKTIAEAIMDTWERRKAQLAGERELPKPMLMNSNLSSVEDIEEASRLPDRIRPSICAFGGLADGFLPFETSEGPPVELELASVVMKAVQARRLGVDTCMPCAGKLGDDADHSKAQVDFRLPQADQEKAKEWMARMFAQRGIETGSASEVLADMYHKVTRERIFCKDRA